MKQSKDMLELLNVNEGVGNTRMSTWKYGIYREAILAAIPPSEEGISFKSLPPEVAKILPQEHLKDLGSVTWHVTSVKLDLEARGLIERIPKRKPQHLRLTEAGLKASQS